MSRNPYHNKRGNEYDRDRFIDLYFMMIFIRDTEAAACFRLDSETPSIWLPKSQITIMSTKDKHIKMVKVPTWLAEEKEIAKYAEKNPDLSETIE